MGRAGAHLRGCPLHPERSRRRLRLGLGLRLRPRLGPRHRRRQPRRCHATSQGQPRTDANDIWSFRFGAVKVQTTIDRWLVWGWLTCPQGGARRAKRRLRPLPTTDSIHETTDQKKSLVTATEESTQGLDDRQHPRIHRSIESTAATIDVSTAIAAPPGPARVLWVRRTTCPPRLAMRSASGGGDRLSPRSHQTTISTPFQRHASEQEILAGFRES